jgi:hypothetical protein
MPEPFRFPAPGFVLGVGEQARPGGDLVGEGDDLGPDPVLIEAVQGQVAETGVFRVADAVLATRAAAMAQLEAL